MTPSPEAIRELLGQLSTAIADTPPRVGIVLAAGHGKRIRSVTSKMLHEIWGRPTVLRVAAAVERGLDSPHQVIVVGVMAADVAAAVGRRNGRVFAYQESLVTGRPAGTGDAVRVALEAFAPTRGERDVYVFLGDMGLLTPEVVQSFRTAFEQAGGDMMVLTGRFSGPPAANTYGRIVRVPALDAVGQPAGTDAGKVIEIREHRDVLSLAADTPHLARYNGRAYSYSRAELLAIDEINTGVFAIKESLLRRYITELNTDNVQGELLLTDLVGIFNRHGRTVLATPAANDEQILAFNVKSVWHQMQSIARRWAYDRLKDVITIADEDDFFLADEVIEHVLELDRQRGPLDIVIGKGAHLGPGVKLNRGVSIAARCQLSGNILFGENVTLGVGVQCSTFQSQTMVLEDGVEILSRNILKGNLRLGAGTRVESGVLMTGSDAFPMRVGRNVVIRGTTYLYGCQIDDGLLIEHSVIKCKHIEQVQRRDGSIQPVRYVLPQPEGLDSLRDLGRNGAR